MNISQVKELVKSYTLANAKVNIMLEGDMGVGKSQVIQQVAQELGYTYVDLRLATQDPGDLVGYPKSVGELMVWTKPCWIPEKTTKLMLVLEELNRAPIDVLQAIMQVTTEYKIHTHELPDTVMIVACINPSDSIYHVSELDPALLSRFDKIKVEYDADIFLKFGYENNVNPQVLQFLGVHRDLGNKPSEKGGPNPRAWCMLSRVINHIPKECEVEAVSGLVGKEAAVTFIKFCDANYSRPVSAKEIFTDYAKVREKCMKQSTDAFLTTVTDVIAAISSTKMTEKVVKNLSEFLQDAPNEAKVKLVKGIPRNVIGKINTINPEFVDQIVTIAKEQNADKK